MLQLTKYFYRISALLTAVGVLCLAVGGRGVMRFLDDISVYRGMTVKQFAVAILLPHMLLLLGLGALAFGVLMLVKGLLFHREHGE